MLVFFLKQKNLRFLISFFWLSLFFIVFGQSFLKKDIFWESQLQVLQKPYSFKKHLKLAEIYFNSGLEEEAKNEFFLTQKLYSFWQIFDYKQKGKKEIDSLSQKFFQLETTRKKIKNWEKMFEEKPYCRDLLLHLALANYKLFQYDKASYYLQKALYLDPNNSISQSLENLIKENK